MASTSDAPRRGPEHDALAAFIGEWHAEGESYAIAQSKTDPRGSVERWVSDETFEWLPGKFFVLQRWKAMTGENAFDGLAVIGYDAERRRYVTRSFRTTVSSANTTRGWTAMFGPSPVSASARGWNSPTAARRRQSPGSGGPRAMNGCHSATAPPAARTERSHRAAYSASFTQRKPIL